MLGLSFNRTAGFAKNCDALGTGFHVTDPRFSLFFQTADAYLTLHIP